MNRKTLFAVIILTTVVSLFVMNSCKVESKKDRYLRKVLANLEQIESATYWTTSESWPPGAKKPTFTYKKFMKEYNNAADTTIGSSFVSFYGDDTTLMSYCYDGNMRALTYEDEGCVVVDSFKVRQLPFRPVAAPFFNCTTSILRYALTTNDSIIKEVIDYGDSVYFGLTIQEDRQVEFFGKAFHMEKTPYLSGEPTSKYELLINKSNNLPYYVRREMSHDISVTYCRDIELNKIKLSDFVPTDYFPAGFPVYQYGQASKSEEVSDLVGKVAPDWVLTDADSTTFALRDFKSKVLMIQFTSVTCGPCKMSTHFLNQLAGEYNEKDFDFVSIESWTKSTDALMAYKERNKITYRFLMSTKEVTGSYQIKSVPVFYILDKDRVIRKIIKGYGTGTTDKEIRDAINELL